MPEKDITSTEGCSLCHGTLLRTIGQHDTDSVPCPECLSVPVDHALRVFAQEWLGDSPWKSARTLTGWHVPTEDGSLMYGVPLYLPAGMDLGVRWLAPTGALGVRWYVSISGVRWRLSWRDGYGEDRSRLYGPVRVGTSLVSHVHAPALATIPTDAPPRLRAARALKLCIEATS